MALLSDGTEFCRNNGGSCGEIPRGEHNITCQVNNSQSDIPDMAMAITVNSMDISSGSPIGITVNSQRYYDGVLTVHYDVPSNAYCTCTVTDERGTYELTSEWGKFESISFFMFIL